jgi:hypothetical protein
MAKICIKLMNVVPKKQANHTPKYPHGIQKVFVKPPMTTAMSQITTPAISE